MSGAGYLFLAVASASIAALVWALTAIHSASAWGYVVAAAVGIWLAGKTRR